ncbi:MAG: teichoic acid biosynthesis protein [Deltaproteobacteria bacterium]|nr:teichoic acid biosynthesis protein [Deltaproteobacteria bacterium]
MRVLYGVVGEGMGHATRSRVVIEHLIGAGHEVEIMTSGRAKDFLAKRFEGVNRIHGLHFVTEENRVRLGKTLWSNVLSGSMGLPRNIEAYFELLAEFRPEVVISDFESWTYLYAKVHRLPVYSIDNMQIINRCRHPPEILEGEQANFEIARAFVKGKLPFCDHYLITTFFKPEIRKPDTSLHPPILRPEILATTATAGDHLLVYQTAEGHDALARALDAVGIECRVYGMHRGLTEEKVEGNLRHRAFSEAGFIADLASARAVVVGGGFTVISESAYFHKPMLVVPLQGQFEQTLNARWVEHLGYGRAAPVIDDAATVRRFLEAVPACEEALSSYQQDGNVDLLGALDELLDRAAAGVD